jgi:beta-fructofuranosidase
MTYQVGDFDPDQISFDMNGSPGVLDYSYGLDMQRKPSWDYNRYQMCDGVLVCQYGAPEAYSQSRGFYATNLLTTPDDRVIMFGWVGGFKSKGWNGCMSLPRELSIDQAGRLIQNPAREVQMLRGRQYQLDTCVLNDEKCVVPGFAGDAMEILVDVKLPHASCFSLSVCDPQKNMSAVLIQYNGMSLNANGTSIPQVYSDDHECLKLQLFYDKTVFELFINDGRQVVTRVAYPASEKMIVTLASKGRAEVVSCSVYALETALVEGQI